MSRWRSKRSGLCSSRKHRRRSKWPYQKAPTTKHRQHKRKETTPLRNTLKSIHNIMEAREGIIISPHSKRPHPPIGEIIRPNDVTNDVAIDDDDELDHEVAIGAMTGDIVGMKYYNGVVESREMVLLEREPDNPYDRNAVRVFDTRGQQVGHLKKRLVAALVGLMDTGKARIEGVVPKAATNPYSMPVTVTLWARPENRDAVIAHVRRHGVPIAVMPEMSAAPAPVVKTPYTHASVSIEEKMDGLALTGQHERSNVDMTIQMSSMSINS